MNKQEMRLALRSNRGSLQERSVQSAAICRSILCCDAYINAGVIAGYAPLTHEADILPVLSAAIAQGKKVLMPLCGMPPQMTFLQIHSLDEMKAGRYGILEPAGDAPEWNVEDIDLILVPLEGIDSRGYRLGKGGGYYDYLLSRTKAYAMGCALTWQMVHEVPCDAWDQPLNACADMHGVHEFSRDERKDAVYGHQKEEQG